MTLFITHYSALMGANRSLLSLLEALNERDKCSVIVPSDGEFTRELRLKSIDYKIVKFHPETYRFFETPLMSFRAAQNEKAVRELADFFEKNKKPDLIYTNSSATFLGAVLAEKIGVPHVWHIREFGEAHYGYKWYPNRERFFEWLSKAKKIICISENLRDNLIPKELHPKTAVVYNGVMSEKKINSIAAAPPDRKKDSFTFINIGMLHPSKGQLETLKAFKALDRNDARLLIIGKGKFFYTLKLHLYKFIFNISNAEIVGYLPDVSGIYEEADALVISSKHEAMGRVTVEAGCYFLPVIGLRSGGTPELIKDGFNGLLYNGNSTQELTDAMRYLYDNRQKAAEMGKNGHEQALERFTTEKHLINVRGEI